MVKAKGREMASCSEAGSDYGVDEDLTRDLESLQEILDADSNSEQFDKQMESATDTATSNLEKLKSCLQKNLNVQTFLLKELDNIDSALLINKRKLDCLTAPKASKRFWTRPFTFWSFRRGKYFRDHCGQSPPAYHNAAHSSASNELTIPINGMPWRKNSSDKHLMDGVRIQMIEMLSQPILTKLQNESNSSSSAKNDLAKLKSMSDVELFKDMNPDDINWTSLSYEMFNRERSSADCKLHWTNHLHPSLNMTEWSKEEDKTLVKLAKKYEEREWMMIARELGTNRTACDCLRHFQSARRNVAGGRQWTREEDKQLKAAVDLYGERSWAKVANHIGNGRFSIQCYHRWISSVHPGMKRGRWSEAEDEKLREGVRVHGNRAWSKVALFVPGRNQSQCRERYLNVLDTDLKKGPWTDDEDKLLMELCRSYKGGAIRWAQVAKQVPHRTDAMCTQRWRQLSSDDEVITQYTKHALKRSIVSSKNHQGSITLAAFEETQGSVPEDVNAMVEKFKKRYYSERNPSRRHKNGYPSPAAIIASGLFTRPPILPTVPEELVSNSSVASGDGVSQTVVYTASHNLPSFSLSTAESTNMSLVKSREEVTHRVSRLLSDFDNSVVAGTPNQNLAPKTSCKRVPRKKKAIKSWNKGVVGQSHDFISPSLPVCQPVAPYPFLSRMPHLSQGLYPVQPFLSPSDQRYNAWASDLPVPMEIDIQSEQLTNSSSMSASITMATNEGQPTRTDGRLPASFTSLPGSISPVPNSLISSPENSSKFPIPPSPREYSNIGASYYKLDEDGKVVKCGSKLQPAAVLVSDSRSSCINPDNLNGSGCITTSSPQLPRVVANNEVFPLNPRYIVQTEETLRSKGYTLLPLPNILTTGVSSSTIQENSLAKTGLTGLKNSITASSLSGLRSSIKTTSLTGLTSVDNSCTTTSLTGLTGFDNSHKATSLSSMASGQLNAINQFGVESASVNDNIISSFSDPVNHEFLSFANCNTQSTRTITSPSDQFSPSGPCAEPVLISHTQTHEPHVSQRSPDTTSEKCTTNREHVLCVRNASDIIGGFSVNSTVLVVPNDSTSTGLPVPNDSTSTGLPVPNDSTSTWLPVPNDSTSTWLPVPTTVGSPTSDSSRAMADTVGDKDSLQVLTGEEMATGFQILPEDVMMSGDYQVKLRMVDGVFHLPSGNMPESAALEGPGDHIERIAPLNGEVGSSLEAIQVSENVLINLIRNDSMDSASNDEISHRRVSRPTRHNSDLKSKGQSDLRMEELRNYIAYDLAGFDLPLFIVGEAEDMLSAHTHIVVCVANTHCHNVKRPYNRHVRKIAKASSLSDGPSIVAKKVKICDDPQSKGDSSVKKKRSAMKTKTRRTKKDQTVVTSGPQTNLEAVVGEEGYSPKDNVVKTNVTKTVPQKMRTRAENRTACLDNQRSKIVPEEVENASRPTPRKRKRQSKSDDAVTQNCPAPSGCRPDDASPTKPAKSMSLTIEKLNLSKTKLARSDNPVLPITGPPALKDGATDSKLSGTSNLKEDSGKDGLCVYISPSEAAKNCRAAKRGRSKNTLILPEMTGPKTSSNGLVLKERGAKRR